MARRKPLGKNYDHQAGNGQEFFSLDDLLYCTSPTSIDPDDTSKATWVLCVSDWQKIVITASIIEDGTIEDGWAWHKSGKHKIHSVTKRVQDTRTGVWYG